MVFTRPISKPSSLWTNPLVTVSSSPFTIDITVPFIFQSFFSSLARSWYLPRISLSFYFSLWSPRTAKSTFGRFSFFVDYYLVWSSGRVWMIRLYLKIQPAVLFHWSLSDSKFSQVYKTLLSNLVDFSSDVFRMVSSVHPGSFPGSFRLFPGLQLRLVSLSPSCFTTISVLWLV